MEIFPAIDLQNGKAVRLFKGDYSQMTVYDDNPVNVAKFFKNEGAKSIHIVDLDGAKSGAVENFEAVKAIVKESGLFCEVGGGIRDEERIKTYLSLGVKRVILGTVAVQNFDFVCQMVQKYGDAIAVGVDVKDGFIAINGWCEVTKVSGYEFCEKCAGAGVKTVIYTDISKDGTLGGTNVNAYKELSNIKNLDIVASGGVSFLNEIEQLSAMGIYGAIVGKAIYTGNLDLATAIEIGHRA
ncbi:MAG: 1-(5-phosphoribosyl)-5-[(5-phosphoribosylamino)methylideneamino]imidazole-4-carboxamide isomerase [Oscillospiraceae bacterium]